jgi:hypothetical protein
MTQGVEEQIGALPAIESEGHFFKVGREMLGAETVPRPHNAALEKRERGFNGVRVNVANHVNLLAVVDRLVAHLEIAFCHRARICGEIIGKEYVHIGADVFLDVLGERSRLHVFSMEEAQIAAALANADDNLLHSLRFLNAKSFLLSTDECFVHFNFAIHHLLIGLYHCRTDTVTEIPCRFVASHSNRALNLASRHAFLRFAEQVCGKKPFSERQVGIVEYRAGSDGELVIAVLAVEQLLFRFQLDHRAFATQASGTFREAETNEQFAALVFGAKQSVYIN